MSAWIVAAVGRWRSGPERALFDQYRERLRGRLTLVEVEEKRTLPTAARKDREAELLLAQVPSGAALIALDERGRAWSTVELSEALVRFRDDGRPAVVFAIGGADGHGPRLLDRADVRLNLGRLTWPHMLVRALMAEQLYRCACIQTGHPYHRE